MTTLTRRERSRLRKTELILTTALQMVGQHGLEALTIQGLARTLDWAPGALYRYFPSKDALFAELQRRVINRYEDELSSVLSTPGATFNGPQGLLDLATTALHYSGYSEADPGVFHLVSMTLGDPQPLLPDREGSRVMAAVDQVLQRITAIIEDAEQQGALRSGSPSDRTLVFWATVQGILQLKKLARFSPDRLNNSRLLRRAITDLLLGWGADPAAVTEAMLQAQERVEEALA